MFHEHAVSIILWTRLNQGNHVQYVVTIQTIWVKDACVIRKPLNLIPSFRSHQGIAVDESLLERWMHPSINVHFPWQLPEYTQLPYIRYVISHAKRSYIMRQGNNNYLGSFQNKKLARRTAAACRHDILFLLVMLAAERRGYSLSNPWDS